jgi:hypothetical protein
MLYNKGYSVNNNNQYILNIKFMKNEFVGGFMKKRNGKYVIFTVIVAVVLLLGYTACKDITPEQTRVEKSVELKLSK